MEIGLLGVPTSVGSHHAGQELAPAALREAGLVGLLETRGHEVTDHGDLPTRVHRAAPRVDGVRAADEVLALLGEVATAVRPVAAAGQVPLVLGGDCTITLGVLAALAPERPHLLYVDGDADLSTPESGSGVLDSMGISHLLGRGDPRMAAFAGRSGLTAHDITLFGTHPDELDADRRDLVRGAGLRMVEADEVLADPAGSAQAALRTIEHDRPALVHVDVDVLDSGAHPVANFPHFGGLHLDDLARVLEVFSSAPLAGVVLTEVNPTYDPSGGTVGGVVDTLARLFAGGDGR